MLDDKISYLKGLYDEENDRQKVVEAKSGQIISNSGIFLSLIGLLITVLYNAKDAIHPAFKVIVAIAITAIIVLYVISMINALKSIDPLKYHYSRGEPDTVNQFNDLDQFKQQLIKDYLISIDTNFKINSRKFEYLGNARQAFVAGIYTTGGLTFILVCYLGFFYLNPPATPQKIEIVSTGSQADFKQLAKGIDQLKQKTLDAEQLKNLILLEDSLNQKKQRK